MALSENLLPEGEFMLKLFTIAQAARFLNMDRRTFEERMKTKKMKAFAKAGKIKLLTEDQLKELKQKHAGK